MIRQLKGIVVKVSSRFIELIVGEITFGISIFIKDLVSVGNTVELFISWQWNSESGPSLYGFISPEDREIFELIITCSGIGPKLALSLVGQLGSSQLIQALITSDSKSLSNVSGVGARKAELMIAQLQPKAIIMSKQFNFKQLSQEGLSFVQVQQVLESLNYSRNEIQQALEYVRKDSGEENSQFDFIMRKSLAFLAKRPQ